MDVSRERRAAVQAAARTSSTPEARKSTAPRPLAVPIERASPPLPSLLPESLLDDDDEWPADSQPNLQLPPTPQLSEAPASRAAPPPPPLPRPAPRPTPQSLPAVVPPPPTTPAIPPSDPALSPPSASIRPEAPSGIHILSEERDELIELLGDSATAREAAAKLLIRQEWLRGRPPVELLIALTHLDYDIETPVFELGRAWEREPICRALIASLRDEPDPKLREHGAWLLKHLSAPNAWSVLAELVSNEAEATAVRRWLLEAIERLVATRGIGWANVGDLMARLVHHRDASLRDGAIGVIAALERSDEKRRVLLEVLRTDDDEVVLASAVQALASALPIVLDPSVAERLLGHPSARVQRSVMDFIERSKRTSKG